MPPTFRKKTRATTKGEGARPWVNANKVVNPQFLPHLQWFRWVHLKNNPGEGKATRTYQQSMADARLLRTAIRDKISHWGKGDAPVGGWGADLIVEAPEWTKTFLAEVEPVEGQEMPDDDEEDDDGRADFYDRPGDDVQKGWEHEIIPESDEEDDEDDEEDQRSGGGGRSVALSGITKDEISRELSEMDKKNLKDALLSSLAYKKASPAQQAEMLKRTLAVEEAWKDVPPAKYEKGKEREVWDKKVANAILGAMPLPKKGEQYNTPAYRARLDAWLAKNDPVPGYTAADARREALLPGGVKAINFKEVGTRNANNYVKREDETEMAFQLRRKTKDVAWGKGSGRETGDYKNETVGNYVERVRAGWRDKKPGESDEQFLEAFKKAKGSTMTVYNQGLGNIKKQLTGQTDAERTTEYYLDMARGVRDLQQGKSTRGEVVSKNETDAQFEARKAKNITDLKSSIFPFVGKNPFEERKEGRGDLAYEIGRKEGEKIVGRTTASVKGSTEPLLTKRLEPPWSDYQEEEFLMAPLSVPVRRKAQNLNSSVPERRKGKEGAWEYYITDAQGKGEWKQLTRALFNHQIKKPILQQIAKHIKELETNIEVNEEDDYNPDQVPLDKALKKIYEAKDYGEALDALGVKTTKKVFKVANPEPKPEPEPVQGTEDKEEEPDKEAGALVDVAEKDEEALFDAYQAHLALQKKPVEGDKPTFFERLNELMARHSMGMEDVRSGLQRIKSETALSQTKTAKHPHGVPFMEHAIEDPKRPGSLAKLKVAKGEGETGVGFVSNREGAKKATTAMMNAGEIMGNPNKGLAKPGQRANVQWVPPGGKAEDAIDVPEEQLFKVSLSSEETFEQAGEKKPQWKTYKDGEGHLPATARAFIDPINTGLMRIFAFDPPREIAQGETDPTDETKWRVRKIDPQFLPAVAGGTMRINPAPNVGRPYRDIEKRMETLKKEREGLEREWNELPEGIVNLFPKGYQMNAEDRILGGGQGLTKEQRRSWTKPAAGAAGLYEIVGGSLKYGGTYNRADRFDRPNWSSRKNQAMLDDMDLTEEQADEAWTRAVQIYFRDEDTGQELDSLKVSGLTGNPGGYMGEGAWGRALQKSKDTTAFRNTRALLQRRPLEEKAKELATLTEEEKEGKTEIEQEELLVIKRDKIKRELQRRGLIPPPGENKSSALWEQETAMGLNPMIEAREIENQVRDEYRKKGFFVAYNTRTQDAAEAQHRSAINSEMMSMARWEERKDEPGIVESITKEIERLEKLKPMPDALIKAEVMERAKALVAERRKALAAKGDYSGFGGGKK